MMSMGLRTTSDKGINHSSEKTILTPMIYSACFLVELGELIYSSVVGDIKLNVDSIIMPMDISKEDSQVKEPSHTLTHSSSLSNSSYL